MCSEDSFELILGPLEWLVEALLETGVFAGERVGDTLIAVLLLLGTAVAGLGLLAIFSAILVFKIFSMYLFEL